MHLKTKPFVLFILVILMSISFKEQAREIDQNEKLFYTAKIWGYLKYYHPKIAKGKYNWDSELIKFIHQQKEVNTTLEFSDLCLKWIHSFGKIRYRFIAKDSTKYLDYFGKNFDLFWLENDVFSKELSKHLRYIERNRSSSRYYADIHRKGAQNIWIKNEFSQQYLDWNEPTTRMLALFRYWNIIEYFFPYKYAMDQDWDEVLKEMIPVFLNVKTETAFHFKLLELTAKINDSHSFYYHRKIAEHQGRARFPFMGLIIDDKLVVNKVVNDSIAKINNIRYGDAITHINGKSISQWQAEKDKYLGASNPSVKRWIFAWEVITGMEDTAEIVLQRDGEVYETNVCRYISDSLKRWKTKETAAPKWKILDDNIGYVNMGILEKKDVSDMMKELFSTKAIIFDIRNYPRNTLYRIAQYLNKEREEFVKFTVSDPFYPGRFYWTAAYRCGGGKDSIYQGRVIVLVNEVTQSHAEFTCMCLQTVKGSIVVGSQTGGADGNVSYFHMVGGAKTRITGLGVYYPDGRETQRIGIVPDIEARPSLEGIRAKKDEVLERAIEEINNPAFIQK